MIVLNKDQIRCKDEILDSIRSYQEFHTLQGAAGVGKTTLISKIIQEIPMGKTICIATPTHKATKVARKMGLSAGNREIEYNTIHSVLGIKPMRQDGVEVYTKDKYAEEKVYDVLIIDESSMLGDDIIEYILNCDSSIIIFVGDQYQISPVDSCEGRISQAFTEVDNISRLTKIVRHDNPIINLATAIRQSQDDGSELPDIITDLDKNGEGIEVKKFNEWFADALAKFKSDKFQEDTDYCRIVAYTNAAVDKINDKIRKIIHGKDVEEYIIGDVLVAQRGHKRNEFKNADELRVINVDEMFDNDHGYDYWDMQVRSLEDGQVFRFNVLKKSSEVKFQNDLNDLSTLAKKDFEGSAKHWSKFWSLMDKYFPVKHIYCCTAHKSQGSTFQYTYVYLKDFLSCYNLFENNALELKQLAYTSITRSAKRTVVNK